MTGELAYRLKRSASRLLRPGGRALVLLYHRVADEASDPYGLSVCPEHFEEHLQAIQELGAPMSLRDLVRGLRRGRVPDRSIAVTFDDGYLDNFTTARPLLEQHAVPATVFFTTGEGGRVREFWWDELERVFLQPGRLPERLELEIGSQRQTWEIGKDAMYTADQQRQYRRWHLLDRDAPTARHAAFRAVYHLVQPLPQDSRMHIMDTLLDWADLSPEDVRDSRRTMTPKQIREIIASGLITAEAHTVSHPALPAQSAETKRTEIARSKETLESWLGEAVHGFAYPYGLYDDDAVAAAREAGLAFACAGDHQKLERRSDPFLLPRIDVVPGGADTLRALFRRHLW